MHKKKKARHVRRSHTKARREKTMRAKKTARRTKSARIKSRPVAVEAPRRRRKKTRRVARSNPAAEFLIEAYQPKGRKFFYYRGDDRLTILRGEAARFRARPQAEAKARYVRARAPRGIDWVRVCPA